MKPTDYIDKKIREHAAPVAPEQVVAAPKAQWEDPRVQAVYDVLCSDEVPPAGQHWEGWASRRIADALSPEAAPAAMEGDYPPLPVAEDFMYQHEDTGITGFIDAQQVEWGFFKNNPRLQKVRGVYSEAEMRAYVDADRALRPAATPAAPSAGVALNKKDLNKLLNDFARACAFGDDALARMAAPKAIHEYLDGAFAALAQPTPVQAPVSRESLVLVGAGALQMVVNALRRDAEEGKLVRGEMADALLASMHAAPVQAGAQQAVSEAAKEALRRIESTNSDCGQLMRDIARNALAECAVNVPSMKLVAYANPVILLPDDEGDGAWEAKVQSHADDVFSLPLYAAPTQTGAGEPALSHHSRVDELTSKWDDDGATRGAAYIAMRDLARQLECEQGAEAVRLIGLMRWHVEHNAGRIDVALVRSLIDLAEEEAKSLAAGPFVQVTKEDATAYCGILRALGMEEEGDALAEVQSLLDLANKHFTGKKE